MSILTLLKCKVYGPKFSHEGIETFLISETLQEAEEYILKKFLYFEKDECEEEITVEINKKELNINNLVSDTCKVREGKDCIEITGKKWDIIRLLRGNILLAEYNDDDEELYSRYGNYRYEWSTFSDISQEEIELLKIPLTFVEKNESTF